MEVGLLRCRPNDTEKGTGDHWRSTEADLRKTAFDRVVFKIPIDQSADL